ncbi:hypothetical protein LCGC14_0308760 [marine sediment metagenome]|uniref:Uncharacterized protein n=1 Tax=marine sediment metagenome TaxID=412755 RepID=A0A0F9TSZ7_9ZZZZ
MPDAVEALGKDVDKKAADELAGFERQGAMWFGAFAAIVLDAEGDAGLVHGDEPAV